MSRKDVFGSVQPGRAAQALAVATPATTPTAGSVRRFSAAIDEMQERAARVDVLEQVISEKEQAIEAARREGERVVEIDPALIDPSPIRDRMAGDPAEDESLRASIAETGQQIPVLLRPSLVEGRYLTVFGHRRVAAARALERKVKAVVTRMADDEAFVVQGIENAERRDLTFVERALFARRLDKVGLTQKSISSALRTTQPIVSKMIKLAGDLPEELVHAIGRGVDIGRPRWVELHRLLDMRGAAARAMWQPLIGAPGFSSMTDVGRLQAVIEALSEPAPKDDDTVLQASDASGVYAFMKQGRGGKMRIEIEPDKDTSFRVDGRPFSEWLTAQLGALRASWRRGE